MKILIVNTSDLHGGAARAAYRLHNSLIKNSVDSNMLVKTKTTNDFSVIDVNSKTKKIATILSSPINNIPLYKYKNKSQATFSSSSFSGKYIIKKINQLKPDIVHLHWICQGLLTIEEIALIQAPIVWTLHDMWPFTGGCHYSDDCENFVNNCGECKVLGSQNKNDLSSKIFNRKEKVYQKKINITIVGLSNWLNNCSKRSALLKSKKHIHLPNPINTNIFKPFDKNNSKDLWNLPKEKKLILFGAMSASSDPRKGFHELVNAMKSISSVDVEFVVFGSSRPKEPYDFNFKVHYLGTLFDDVSLVTLYNAVDVMVVPSLQENLSNTIMESLSCGVPVVAFDIGGNNDMIDHLKNGYLAKPFDTEDLAIGIDWVVNNKKYTELSENARRKVMRNFDSDIVAQKYINLYKEILNKL